MTENPRISILFGYRNREIMRVRRSLDSLVDQTEGDFEVLFVDYGSDPDYQQQIQSLVERYAFCRYIYAETRGQPWNRSHALNIAARQAQGQYLLANDVDLIFGREFVAGFSDHAASDRVLYTSPYRLPRDFADWENLAQYHGQLPIIEKAGRGISLMPATVFRELRGFDEFYRYYGGEDRDLYLRLTHYGLTARWITEQTPAYHQWHPPANYQTQGLMPTGVWERMRIYLHTNQERLTRNTEAWGTLPSRATRLVFQFIDPDTREITVQQHLQMVDHWSPTNPEAVSYCIRSFFELPSGHALAVDGADFPQRPPMITALLPRVNGLLLRLGYRTRLNYSNNPLHDALAYLIEVGPVADYYLDADGISILVRA